MTEILGNKLCIDNLRRDISDIQKAVGSLTSRLGHVVYTSWKYPDKLASNVDVEELLEMCDYDAEFPEENRISHVLLLELVIDRLLFYVQCSSKFMEVTNSRAVSAKDNHNSSIGVVTKKCTNKFLQYQSDIQQLLSDNKTQSRKIKELQEFNQKLQDDLGKYHQGVTQVSANNPNSTNACILPPIHTSTNKETKISNDFSNKSSQTVETAFVPCENCLRVQNNLASVGDAMINLCLSQKLPTSLDKYRKQLKGVEWLSCNDLARWNVEQNKDIDRLNQHLRDLINTIEPLKSELSSSISTCRDLEKRVDECMSEVARKDEKRLSLEAHHKQEMEKAAKQHGEVKADLTLQCKTLENSRLLLEQKLKEARCEMELHKSKYKELEDIKQQLMVELEESKTNNAEVKKLNAIVTSLEQELHNRNDEMNDLQKKLTQEKAISKSLSSRTESLQSKYDALVKRMEKMDEENGLLESELSALTEEKERLLESVTQAQNSKEMKSLVESLEDERAILKSKISTLEENVLSMEKTITEIKERERLLIEFPDLNGPVNADLAGTGDLYTDMSNQVKANEIRMQLLEKQNVSMKKTLSKLGHQQPPSAAYNAGSHFSGVTSLQANRAEPTPDKPSSNQHISNPSSNHLPVKPTQLWSMTHEAGDSSANNHYGASSKTTRPNSGTYTKNSGTGSSNAKNRTNQVSHDASSIDAYMKLKKAGLLKNDSTKPSTNSLTCPNCDKLYHSAADLELHRSYCAKR